MMARRHGLLKGVVVAFLAWGSAVSLGIAQAVSEALPHSVDGLFEAKAQDVSALDRETRRIESIVQLSLRNKSAETAVPPLHLVVHFELSGPAENLRVEGALGGAGEGPYGAHFYDLGEALVDGLAPGATIQVELRFSRPSEQRLNYRLELRGILNGAPEAVPGGPYAALVGEDIVFDASGSSDPDGDELGFRWDFGDGEVVEGPVVRRSFAVPGVYEAQLRVEDGRGGLDQALATATVFPRGTFALGRTRTLDGVGHPLGGVWVEEDGPGPARVLASDGESGFASLGGQPGEHVWKFSLPGHLPVWRRHELPGGVRLVPSPWMAKESQEGVAASLLEATHVESESGAVELTFPAGSFSEFGEAAVTELSGQSLPFPLPGGWSPLGAFHLRWPGDLAGPATAVWKGGRESREASVLVHFEEEGLVWRVATVWEEEAVESRQFGLSEAGWYAVARADLEPEVPPGPEEGQILAGVELPSGLDTGWSAEGEAEPEESAASRTPEDVTSAALVKARAPVAVPSGIWLRTLVRERYALADGSALSLPEYDTTFFAYHVPGIEIADTLYGRFPLRPRLLFGGEELHEAEIEVEVLSPADAVGAVLTAEGGILTGGGVRVTVPAGALSGLAAAELRGLDTRGFAALAGGLDVFLAFELNAGGLREGAQLGLHTVNPVEAHAFWLLARLLNVEGAAGLEPVERFRSDESGKLMSLEEEGAEGLPGLSAPGQYALVRVPGLQGLVRGTVRNEAEPGGFAGAVVRISGEPWLALSREGGAFATTALIGSGEVVAFDLVLGGSAESAFVLELPAAEAQVELTLEASGPRVVRAMPANGATDVSTVSAVSVVFSEAVAPLSFGGDGIALRQTADGVPVDGARSLSLNGRTAFFYPAVPLEPGTSYTIEVAGTVTDVGGLPLAGERVFVFGTASVEERAAGAQLVIYEPGAEMVPEEVLERLVGYDPVLTPHAVVAHGTPGVADPGVPVILINEATRETATVLSAADGSFAGFIEAEESDFISAVFVNANGTRVVIPAARQLFDDGSVGLFRQGGILEAESDGGPVEVFIEPGAVPSRTKFKIDVLPRAKLLEFVQGTEPESGQLIGGFTYQEEGDPLRIAADVVFPVNPADLDLPPGSDPADATFVLAAPRGYNGVVAYEVVDRMDYEETEDGQTQLVTRSPPFVGLLPRRLEAIRGQLGTVDTVGQTVRASLDEQGGVSPESSTGIFVVVMSSPSRGLQAAGKVLASNAAAFTGEDGDLSTLPVGDALGVELAGDEPVGGALVRTDAAGREGLPGEIRAGEQFTTSNFDGSYAFYFSADEARIGRIVVATHPRFPFQKARSEGFGGVPATVTAVRAHLRFRKLAALDLAAAGIEDSVRPALRISHSPLSPEAGLGDGATVRVTATDDLSMQSITVTTEAFLSLATGLPQNLELVTLTTLPAQTQGARMRQSFRFMAEQPGRLRLQVTAVDGAGNARMAPYGIVFGGPPVEIEEGETPRQVQYVWPPDGSTGVPLFTPVTIRFSRPLTEGKATSVGDWVTLSDLELRHGEVSEDRREMVLYYGLAPGAAAPEVLALTLDGTVVDQDPQATAEEAEEEGEEGSGQGFSYGIAFVPRQSADLPHEFNGGGGVVVSGATAYALDEDLGAGGGRLVVFDLENPLSPSKTDEIELDEPPSDLSLVPHYAFRLADGALTDEANWLAVFSGEILGTKHLNLFRLDGDGDADLEFRGPLSADISRIVKSKWDPPLMGYLELGAGATGVTLLNLNAWVVGVEASAAEKASFPEQLDSGKDLNNDGDYADPGEKPPLPSNRGGQLFGLEFTWAPPGPLDRVVDFDFSADFGLMGAVMRTPEGGVLQMVLGGEAGFLPESARVVLGDGDPKRLFLLPAQRVQDGPEVLLLDLALVSMVGNPGALAVVDVTEPDIPIVLRQWPLPQGAGSANSIVRRDDGLLTLATSSGGGILIDPLLLLTETAAGSAAAFIDRLEGMQTVERSFAAEASGLQVVTDGAGKLLFTAPTIELVTFDETLPFAPEELVDRPASEILEILGRARPVTTAEPLEIPRPGGAAQAPPLTAELADRHFYVLLRAPGTDADEVEMAAAAIHGGGLPVLPSPGEALPVILGQDVFLDWLLFLGLQAVDFLFADAQDFVDIARFLLKIAEEALGDAGDYDSDLTAVRLSEDRSSPLYNLYLAGPVVLLRGDPGEEVIDALQDELDRRYLKAAHSLWVGIGPGEDGELLEPFAARQDQELSLSVPALNALAGGAVQQPKSMSGLLDLLGLAEISLTDPFLTPGLNDKVFVGSQRNPLIVIPGIAGTHLENPDRLPVPLPVTPGPFAPPFPEFVQITEAWPGYLSAFQQDLSLDPDSAKAIVASDVIRRIPETYTAGTSTAAALVASLKTIDIYRPLISYLKEELGYQEYDYIYKDRFELVPREPKDFAALRTTAGADFQQVARRPDLFVFPYDWRKDNVDSVKKLEEYVDLVRLIHPDASGIDIVAHSMGGLVSRRFILENPGVVDRLITVGSPFLGAPKAILAMETGDMDDFVFNVIIRKSLMKTLAEHFEGAHQLLPGPQYFQLAGSPLAETGWDISGDETPYGDLSYAQFRETMDLLHPDGTPGTVNDAFYSFSAAGGNQADWSDDATGVEYFHIYGVQSSPKTVGKVRAALRPHVREIDAETTAAGATLDEVAYSTEFEVDRVPGDGTVPRVSASRMAGGGNMNAPDAAVIGVFSDDPNDDALVEHNGMLGNPEVLAHVGSILQGTFTVPPPDENPAGRTTVIKLVNAEADSIEVTDSMGNPLPATGEAGFVDIVLGTLLEETMGISREIASASVQIIDGDPESGDDETNKKSNVTEVTIQGTDYRLKFGFDEERDLPMTVRVEQKDPAGTTERMILYENITRAMLAAPAPQNASDGTEEGAPLTTEIEGAPVDFESTLVQQAPIGQDIHSLPTLIHDTQEGAPVNDAPEVVLEGPPVLTPPLLRHEFVEGCTKIRFFLDQLNPATGMVTLVPDEEAEFWVAFEPSGVLQDERTAIVERLRGGEEFEVERYRDRIVSGQVYVTGIDGSRAVSKEEAIGVATVRLWLDEAKTMELTDHPVERDGNGAVVRFRSPKRYLGSKDRIFAEVRDRPGAGDLKLRVERVEDNGSQTLIVEQLLVAGAEADVYEPPVQFVLADQTGAGPDDQTFLVQVIDEQDLVFTAYSSAEGPDEPRGRCSVMVDRSEIASGGLQVFFQDLFPGQVVAESVANRDGYQANGFSSAGERVFSNTVASDAGGSANNNLMSAFFLNAGDNLPASKEADFVMVSCHGVRPGFLVDHDQAGGRIILVPEAASAFGSNGTRWKDDFEWAYFSACLNLVSPESDIPDVPPSPNAILNDPSGAKNWRTALQGSNRPGHGLLGAFTKVRAGRVSSTIMQRFWNGVLAGDSFLVSYKGAMESEMQNWAALYYADYENDSPRELGADRPLGQLGDPLYDFRENIFPPAPFCEKGACASGEPLAILYEGRCLVMVDLAALESRIPAEAAPIQALPFDPLADSTVPGAGRRQRDNATDLELWEPLGPGDRPVTELTFEEVSVLVQAFLRDVFPSLDPGMLHLAGGGVHRRGRLDAEGRVQDVRATGFDVFYQFQHGGIPLFGDQLRVRIEGDAVRSCSVVCNRPVDGVAGGAAKPVLRAEEALEKLRPVLERRAAGGGRYAVVEAEFCYVCPDTPAGALRAGADSVKRYVPAWRFLIDSNPDSSGHGIEPLELWVHACDGNVFTPVLQ